MGKIIRKKEVAIAGAASVAIAEYIRIKNIEIKRKKK